MSKPKADRKIGDLREEVSMIDMMLSSLVDILEEKGMVSHQEWERKVKF